jgi:hypothetical protein
MKKYDTPRKSHCSVCGKRLSEKTDSGSILWYPGHVDDSGIYCESCAPPRKKGNKGRKNART